MEIVWLKRDVRLNDHGPLAQVAKSNRPLVILYNYEPDQLVEKTVHGSHVSFINEGLVDLDKRLSLMGDIAGEDFTGDFTTANNGSDGNDGITSKHPQGASKDYAFQVLTVCHAGVVYTLNSLLQQSKEYGGIHRILTHEETGHLKSFARDKAVRRWCKSHGIPIMEYNQTGVTRCLKSRDDFSTNFQSFIRAPLWPTPSKDEIQSMQRRLVKGLSLHGLCRRPLSPQQNELLEIPLEHRVDREDRQKGGESQALKVLESFLNSRGRHYSSGISSPNTSWTTGGRISPYLSWGHVSTRYVIHKLCEKREELRQKKNSKTLDPIDGPWLRSLAAFSSRMHWRSHFIQKLETEPLMEQTDLCEAYQHLRRQPGDWNQEYYDAWASGNTGFPFVDACMRCLIRHGWLNFRMRAMLVSFATYNLWLDWKKIAPHLARLFLDYEPGIHYPQLQMQAGTTGINAMRVYSVTKQGKDQDPDGTFIRKYVQELQNVPLEYIHEPSKMSRSMQERYGVILISTIEKNRISSNQQQEEQQGDRIAVQQSSIFRLNTPNDPEERQLQHPSNTKKQKAYNYYALPIVDEKQSASKAKDLVASVRKQGSTKRLAEKVYLKHGSRSSRNGNMDGVKPKALSSTIKRVKVDEASAQHTIQSMFMTSAKACGESDVASGSSTTNGDSLERGLNIILEPGLRRQNSSEAKLFSSPPHDGKKTKSNPSIAKYFTQQRQRGKTQDEDGSSSWECTACTFLNDKPLALSCLVCGTLRM